MYSSSCKHICLAISSLRYLKIQPIHTIILPKIKTKKLNQENKEPTPSPCLVKAYYCKRKQKKGMGSKRNKLTRLGAECT